MLDLTVLFCYVLAQAVHAHAMVQGNVGACDTPSKCRFDGKSDFIVKDDHTALRQGALLAIEALHLNPTERMIAVFAV